MPLIKIEIYKGKNQSYKNAILDTVHEALVNAFKIPENDRNQRIYELDEENFERREGKSDQFTIIEITAFQGRSINAKRQLYAEIFEGLAKNPGIDQKDIIVYINEPPPENWGIRGLSSDQIDFGFKVRV